MLNQIWSNPSEHGGDLYKALNQGRAWPETCILNRSVVKCGCGFVQHKRRCV